jgi:hypothetical protein
LGSTERTIEVIVDFFSSLMIGVFLGFVFGVGCALAVMYSIYMGPPVSSRPEPKPSPPLLALYLLANPTRTVTV